MVGTWLLAAWVIGWLGGPGLDVQAATGLIAVAVIALGFTAIYREGFEIVLFLQNMRLNTARARCSRAWRSAWRSPP